MSRRERPLLLALRALGLGDLLTAVPALRGLRRGFPEHEVVLATPSWLAPLVAQIDAVDHHLPVAELERLPDRLRGEVAVAVNLHGRGPQSHALLVRLDPARLLAFRHPDVPSSRSGPDWTGDEHEVVRWCRLVRHAGGDADRDDLALPRPPVGSAAVARARGATLIHPGAKSGARRWPAERFAAVAADEAAAGRPVVITGSAAERDLAARVAGPAGLPDAAILAGRLDLAELAAAVADAARIVCGDTGVAHLATAMGTPSVVLFGPTPPSAWGPPPVRRDRHRVLWAGDTGDPLSDVPFAGLLAIGTDAVRRELAALATADTAR